MLPRSRRRLSRLEVDLPDGEGVAGRRGLGAADRDLADDGGRLVSEHGERRGSETDAERERSDEAGDDE